MRLRSAGWLAAAALAMAAPGAVEAKPAYLKSMASYFGPLLPAKVSDCRACHVADDREQPRLNPALPKPHNTFGARLMKLGEELARARRPSTVEARLDAAAREDADGDGVPNNAELLSGRWPGSRADVPSAAEKKALPQLLAALERRRGAYAWRPFEPVRRPAVPGLAPGSPAARWARNPVDAFVAAAHRDQGLRPRPEAPPNVLIRRIYLDLTGLPPTAAEVEAFERESRTGGRAAYERLVDRLLASPQYGERWARHWMDVWRYSDWDGYGAEVRNSQPHIWRWRDWIVHSLNADKGYDRMVQEMLAADELAPEDTAALPATGFLVRNWYKFSRHETLNKVIEGTGKAFLGVTLNCARCHDHKFDPISQADYFNFRAVFEPFDIRTERIPGQPDLGRDGIARVFDADLKAETFFLLQGDDRKPDKSRPAHAAVPAALGGPAYRPEPRPVPTSLVVPDRRPFVLRETVAASEAAVAAARTGLIQAQAGADAARRPEATRRAELELDAAEASHAALLAVLRVEELEAAGSKGSESWRAAAVETTTLQRRAAAAESLAAREAAAAELAKLKVAGGRPAQVTAAEKKLADAAKKVEESRQALAAPPSPEYTPRIKNRYPETSSGRRLALARWITARENPLAARVAVNHLWLRHFGRPLVPSVFDFGGNGQPPSHPALLDWLAAELMEHGWSMKRLHRLLVTSSAYRMDSTAEPASLAKDPDNRYLWRMNARRMEAEAVRDAVLHAAGELDLTRGGPELDQAQGLTSKRRSLYFRHSVEKQVEFLATFDQANVNECYERVETIVPQQALALANSGLSLSMSRVLAGRLWKQVEALSPAQAEEAFVEAAFRQVLCRPPSTAERAECARFLTAQASLLAEPARLTRFEAGPAASRPPAADPRQRAREGLVHVLFNHHEYVQIR